MGESGRPSQIVRLSESDDSGILNERVLMLVFESMKWDIHTLCRAAAVNRKLRALAKRLLWRELCIYRAPRMISTLMEGSTNSRVIGGWPALAKILFYCGGCESTRNFQLSRPSPGHFVESSRFSKTSGRSFLAKRCRGDVLYVSDPCEHSTGDRQDDVGIYRGVWGIHEIEDEGVFDKETGGVRGGCTVPVLRRTNVEHDGGTADSEEERRAAAGLERRRVGVFRVLERAPPRHVLVGAAFLRRGRGRQRRAQQRRR